MKSRLGRKGKGGERMNRYEMLLINLLRSIDQKLGTVVGLLEVGQDTKNCSDNSTDADKKRPK